MQPTPRKLRLGLSACRQHRPGLVRLLATRADPDELLPMQIRCGDLFVGMHRLQLQLVVRCFAGFAAGEHVVVFELVQKGVVAMVARSFETVE